MRKKIEEISHLFRTKAHSLPKKTDLFLSHIFLYRNVIKMFFFFGALPENCYPAIGKTNAPKKKTQIFLLFSFRYSGSNKRIRKKKIKSVNFSTPIVNNGNNKNDKYSVFLLFVGRAMLFKEKKTILKKNI